MDIQNASDLLGLSSPFSLQELKKCYYKAALRWHPDKNGNSIESKNKFQEIQDAYEMLTEHLEIDNPPERIVDYKTIFKTFLTSFTDFNPRIVEILRNGCEDTIFKLLKEVDEIILSQLYTYLSVNSTFLHVNPNFLERLESLLREKTENYVIVHPSLDNLFNDDIYPIHFQEDTYYVPLWHDVLTYPLEKSNEELTIKCSPHLPEHVNIDHANNIHVNLTAKISNLLDKQKLVFYLGEKVFEIAAQDLNIKKNQMITLKDEGISKIDQKTIFNIDNKSNIVVYLELT